MGDAIGNRNVQTVLAEEMADAAQAALLAGESFDAGLLLQTLELTDGGICQTSHGHACAKSDWRCTDRNQPGLRPESHQSCAAA